MLSYTLFTFCNCTYLESIGLDILDVIIINFLCRIIEKVLRICSGRFYLVFPAPLSLLGKAILHIVL